tara:strand:+ start:2686 stop:2865 length:180 start_codon:yes stop_codon:yes gene_type:complete
MENPIIIGEDLKNFDEEKSSECVWDALHRAKENNLLSEEEWDNICLAMAWLGLTPEGVN